MCSLNKTLLHSLIMLYVVTKLICRDHLRRKCFILLKYPMGLIRPQHTVCVDNLSIVGRIIKKNKMSQTSILASYRERVNGIQGFFRSAILVSPFKIWYFYLKFKLSDPKNPSILIIEKSKHVLIFSGCHIGSAILNFTILLQVQIQLYRKPFDINF